jgi:hypothetical protein
MEEHRQSRRRRILKGARIVFNNKFTAVDCRVRNLSEGGALLEVAGTAGIPDRFSLVMADGEARECEVRTRATRALGVHFLRDGS